MLCGSNLVKLSYFGLPGAFPKNALLPELAPDATEAERLVLLRTQQSLIEQAFLTHQQGTSRYAQAESLGTFSQLSQEEINRLTVEEKAEIYQKAGALILGDAFSLDFLALRSRTGRRSKAPMLFPARHLRSKACCDLPRRDSNPRR